MFSGIADAVGDLNGLLPDGRTVSDLAGSPDERRSFVKHVREAERRWNLLAADLGPETVLRMLACSAGWRARHWWGTPWWPARVARFVSRAEPMGGTGGRWIDPERLRRDLLLGLDLMDAPMVAACLAHGLGDPVSAHEPKVSRRRFASLTALIEPDTPPEARVRIRDELCAREVST